MDEAPGYVATESLGHEPLYGEQFAGVAGEFACLPATGEVPGDVVGDSARPVVLDAGEEHHRGQLLGGVLEGASDLRGVRVVRERHSLSQREEVRLPDKDSVALVVY
jgi:hypothetical protein